MHYKSRCYIAATASIFYLVGLVVFGVYALVCPPPVIPAAILTIQSHRNLDNIVEAYNANANDVSLNFGATSNGIRLVLKF